MGKLEVELYGSALEISLQGVGDSNVNLGSIKRTVSLIKLPLPAAGRCECIQGFFQLRFCDVPGLEISEVLLGPRGKLKLERETKKPVDTFKKVEETLNFLCYLSASHFVPITICRQVAYLILSTKYMGVVLLKFSNPGQAIEGTGRLVPVQNTKVRHSKR